MLERLSDNLMRECTCVTSGRKETNRLTVIFQRKKDHSEEDVFFRPITTNKNRMQDREVHVRINLDREITDLPPAGCNVKDSIKSN